MKSAISLFALALIPFKAFAVVNQGCIISTDNVTAQQYLVQQGYSVVTRASQQPAHIFLDFSDSGQNYGECDPLIGIICHSHALLDVSVQAELPSGVVFFSQNYEKDNSKYYGLTPDREARNPSLSKGELVLTKAFVKKLQAVDLNCTMPTVNQISEVTPNAAQ